MLARPLSSSARRSRIIAAGLLLLVCVAGAHAARRHPPLSPFERAEHMRDALEALPEAQRTRVEYELLLNAYRAVYHANPADPKAQQSIDTVAVLLAEEGRIFHSEKPLRDAIAQCEFLRAQYPGGPFSSSALLMEASVSLHDLHDRAAAKADFEKFLADYPNDPLAAQARVGRKEIRRPGKQSEIGAEAPASASVHDAAPTVSPRNTHRSTVLDAAHGSQAEQASRTGAPAQPIPAAHDRTAKDNELNQLGTAEPPAAAAPTTLSQPAPASEQSAANAAAGQPVLTGATRVAAQQHRGRLPLVTNVRHWSTPVYTRVAIDLQDQVEYEAARVPNPDRIYFDLHGAKVAPELIGRSVDVTDDGFLQRIRVAQFSNDVTRVVLDVSQVSEYSAFFLPNPWRLIIDIHGARPGGKPPGPPVQIAAAPAPAATAAQPPATQQPTPDASQAGTPSPKALRDIAALGTRADQVRATRKPTTQPIAASVPGRPREHAPTTVTVDDGPADDPANSVPASKPNLSPTLEAGSTPSPGAASSHQSKSAHRPAPGDSLALGDDDTLANRSRDSAHEASSIDGQRSLTRALGLKIGRIVVDAGHGGHDSGTLGPGGIEEKEVVLDVSLRLGKLLRQRMGAQVTFTRDDDTFIPLETRTAIANKAQADLFISVHANSSPDPTARGVETYYLNFTTSPDALEVAARENAVSDQSVHELSGLVKKITLKDKIDESRTFAADVEQSLYAGLEQGNPGLRDRGVKKAPFVVLIGANMPSILAEISFLTNASDAAELREPAYRQRIAESLYRGVARYVSGLSGLRVAQTNGGPAGN
jgi:N-acetylmuramoyl-L-alanine amidase